MGKITTLTTVRRCLLWLSAVTLAGSLGAPLLAASSDPFAYKMEITPEEGHVDPAIDQRYTAKFAACQKRARVTLENAACFEAEFVQQDAALNRAWRATLGRLPIASLKPLIEAQRKWVVARDAFCKGQSDEFSGGTIAPIVYVSCRVELSIRRSIWLEHLH